MNSDGFASLAQELGKNNLAILIIGLMLGVGKAFIIEFLPEFFSSNFSSFALSGNLISFGILGL